MPCLHAEHQALGVLGPERATAGLRGRDGGRGGRRRGVHVRLLGLGRRSRRRGWIRHGTIGFGFALADARLAILCGSQARGTAHDDSDIDIAVDASEMDLLDLAAMLMQAFDREVDVVPPDDPSISLQEQLVRNGSVVVRVDSPSPMPEMLPSRLRCLTIVSSTRRERGARRRRAPFSRGAHAMPPASSICTPTRRSNCSTS
jgi:predicted nucleotidyltransferase